MSAKTYQLDITKSDGTSEKISFTITDVTRTYKLRFKCSDGSDIYAGDISVGKTENSYDLKLKLSNESVINVGTIVTPVAQTPSFNEASWSIIEKISESGKANEYFAVGDEKTIELSTGEQITLVILGFNHDEIYDGSGRKAGITIGMKNLLSTLYSMNSTSTNEGGWDKSKMRNVTMDTIYSQLPSDLRLSIKRVLKKTGEGKGSSSIRISNDLLWLFSEVEIDGTTSELYSDEGEQYEYWKTVKDGKNPDDRIKIATINFSPRPQMWLLRSSSNTTSYLFTGFNPSGKRIFISGDMKSGVCLGFCV